MNKLIALSVVALSMVSGCAVRMSRPEYTRPLPPPPPIQQPAPVVQRMSYDEAVSRALDYAHSRGFASRVKKAHLTGNDVWKVKLEVVRADAKGKIHIDLDAYSREVIRAQEHVKFKKPKHHKKKYVRGDWDEDEYELDDDDDWGPDRGRGKGKHKASAVAKRN